MNVTKEQSGIEKRTQMNVTKEHSNHQRSNTKENTTNERHKQGDTKGSRTTNLPLRQSRVKRELHQKNNAQGSPQINVKQEESHPRPATAAAARQTSAVHH
jgi:hypothetical protein